MTKPNYVLILLCACSDPSVAFDASSADAGRDAGVVNRDSGTGSDASTTSDATVASDSAIPDAGTDAGTSGRECERIVDDIVGWMDAHASCDEGNPCELIIAPSPFDEPDPDTMYDYVHHPRTCGRNVAAPNGERDALTTLVREFHASGCVIPAFGCGFMGGLAECRAGSCVLAESGCETCDETLDPVCTVDGQNARNRCQAERCFLSMPAHSGYCPDSAACTAVGGTCNEALPGESPCADGTWPARPDPYLECASGFVDNTCCVPTAFPCAFVEGSYTLERDPFTCGAVPPASVCVSTGPQTSCVLDGSISGAGGAASSVVFDVGAGGDSAITGRDPATGRTFECTATLTGGPFGASEWRCRACDAAGACSECAIDSINGCAIPE